MPVKIQHTADYNLEFQECITGEEISAHAATKHASLRHALPECTGAERKHDPQPSNQLVGRHAGVEEVAISRQQLPNTHTSARSHAGTFKTTWESGTGPSSWSGTSSILLWQ